MCSGIIEIGRWPSDSTPWGFPGVLTLSYLTCGVGGCLSHQWAQWATWAQCTTPTGHKVSKTSSKLQQTLTGETSGYYITYLMRECILQEYSSGEALEHCTELWSGQLCWGQRKSWCRPIMWRCRLRSAWPVSRPSRILKSFPGRFRAKWARERSGSSLLLLCTSLYILAVLIFVLLP